MVAFYEAGFWVLISVIVTGMGAYFLWAQGFNKRLIAIADNKMSKEECNTLGVLRAEPLQKDIGYLKEGQVRLESQMTNMQKTLNEILRVLNGGVREKF